MILSGEKVSSRKSVDDYYTVNWGDGNEVGDDSGGKDGDDSWYSLTMNYPATSSSPFFLSSSHTTLTMSHNLKT